MQRTLLKLWNDDDGIVALEYLLLATVVGLGLVVGMSALSEALNVELVELGNAILALDQSYTYCAQISSTSKHQKLGFRAGTATQDTFNGNQMTVRQSQTPVNISLVP
jgi:Flp pilus assembly pilin Flp